MKRLFLSKLVLQMASISLICQNAQAGLFDNITSQVTQVVTTATRQQQVQQAQQQQAQQQQEQIQRNEDQSRKIQAKAEYDMALRYSGVKGGVPLLDRAVDAFNKAVELNPDYGANPQFLTDRGTTYLKMGSFSQAMTDFNTAISVSPSFSKAYYERSVLDNQQGQITQAMSDINMADLTP